MSDAELAAVAVAVGGAAAFARAARVVARATDALTDVDACFPAMLLYNGALPELLSAPAPEAKAGDAAVADTAGPAAPRCDFAPCAADIERDAELAGDALTRVTTDLYERASEALACDYDDKVVFGGVIVGRSRTAGAPLSAVALQLGLHAAAAEAAAPVPPPPCAVVERLTLLELAAAVMATANAEAEAAGEIGDCGGLPDNFLPPGWAGEPTLHSAAQFGLDRVVRALLARGAAVDAERANPDEDYPLCTPLFLACHYNGNAAVVRALVAAGADVDRAVDDAGEQTPLKTAIDRRQLAVALALVEAGADVNAGGRDADADFFETPLHLAQRHKCGADFCAALEARGAVSRAGAGRV